MKQDTIDELISDLMAACGFGAVVSPIVPVSGGLMHRMYKVYTGSGKYAVKHLNPKIMSREGVHENYERAEKIESLLEKEGIPIVPAIPVFGKKMQNVNGSFFYIFKWQEGHIADWNHISKEMCNTAGNILGKIHAINPQSSSHQEPELSKINWQDYVHRANDERNEIASILADNVGLLVSAEEELNKARASLPDIMCISDEDMDPKNILWDNGSPWVIDLECLDYGNPISHALQLALQWSGTVICRMDIDKMTAFFDGYLAAYDNGFRAYSGVFGLAYTWVEWLEYNIQRALGTCSDEAERALGISEAKNTINRIKYIRNMEKEMKEALDSRLPRKDSFPSIHSKDHQTVFCCQKKRL